jgi:hypothetical protein
VFTSEDEVRSAIVGTWRICSGSLIADKRLFPSEADALVIEGDEASLLVERDGALVRATRWHHDYRVSVYTIDHSDGPLKPDDPPVTYQVVLEKPGFSWGFEPRSSDTGDALRLAENPYLPYPGDLFLAREVTR